MLLVAKIRKKETKVRYIVFMDNQLFFIVKAMDKDKDTVWLENCSTKEYRKVKSESLNNMNFKEFKKGKYYSNNQEMTFDQLLDDMKNQSGGTH